MNGVIEAMPSDTVISSLTERSVTVAVVIHADAPGRNLPASSDSPGLSMIGVSTPNHSAIVNGTRSPTRRW